MTAKKCPRQPIYKERRFVWSNDRACVEQMSGHNLIIEQRGWGGAQLRSSTTLLGEVLMTSTRSTFQRDAPVTRRPRLGSLPKVLPLPYGLCLPLQWALRRYSAHNQAIENSVTSVFCLCFIFICAQQ